MIAARRMLRPAPGAVRSLCTPLALASLLLVVLSVRPVAAQTGVIEYYGQDALGSIRIVFDVNGVATARADFEPFGELFTVPAMPGGQLPTQQFTGQERDPEASQDYFGARFYQPRAGRFSQVDPVYAGLFDTQQWNRYAYAKNNPLTFVDPDWRDTISSTCYYDDGLNMEICHVVGQDLSPKPPPSPTSNYDGWYFPDFGAVGSYLAGFMPEVTPGDQWIFTIGGANFVVAAAGAAVIVAAPTATVVATSATLSNAPAATTVVVAAGGGAVGAVQLGRSGEAAAMIVKNTQRIPSASSTAAYRIPDVLNHATGIIGEVKNVGALAYTSQLRDFAAYAAGNGYTFELWVRPTTQLSGPLQQAVTNGQVVLRLLP